MRSAILIVFCVFAAVTLALVTGAEEQEPQAEVPRPIPESAKSIENPRPATAESVDNGKLLFASQCAMCHGEKGDGTGDLVGRLKLKLPDLSDAAVQKQWTDGELFWVLTNGHGRMPDKKRFREEIRWDMINYVRTLDD